MKARICFLHKTEAEWDKASKQYFNTHGKPLILEAGELVIYDPDENCKYTRLKVGDGEKQLHELDFFINSTTEDLMLSHQYSEIIDGGRISTSDN